MVLCRKVRQERGREGTKKARMILNAQIGRVFFDDVTTRYHH